MPEQPAPWTIGRLLTWTTDYLKQHGSESPRLDAEVLLAHARGCQRIELYACFDEVADEPLRESFRDLVKQRSTGKPVAYLVGFREFYSRDFEVTPDVLVPRPETEFVIVALLDEVDRSHQRDQPLRVVDVGTGSGILAVCSALELPHAKLTAIDLSPEALAVARRNAERHGVQDRIEFVHSDLFAKLDTTEAFDYVISNPPYVAEHERTDLANDVVDFEPHGALFAGAQGMDVIRRLVHDAPPRLRPQGGLICEFSPTQVEPLKELMDQQTQFDDLRFVPDLSKQPRIFMATRR